MKSILKQLDYLFPGYFHQRHIELLSVLPIPASTLDHGPESLQVELPNWCTDLGVGKPAFLVIPKHCLCPGEGSPWRRVDWFRAAFDMATCQHEITHERESGTIHSYASRLTKSLEPFWSHAWVNRILLFLRCWAARNQGSPEIALFGPKPRGRVHLTHDVDYVGKTLALRLKQSAFSGYNTARSTVRGQLSEAGRNIKRLFQFGFGAGDYWQFPAIEEMEAEFGATSVWHFYGGPGGLFRSPSQLLLDPSYCVEQSRLKQQIQHLLERGHHIGMHQGFHSWRDPNRMLQERRRLQSVSGSSVVHSRQHWLRFSFADTWLAQENAGILLDATLGFNDRPAFRNAAALCLPAWIPSRQEFSRSLKTLPLVLMDSHLFDYGMLDQRTRYETMDRCLDEIAFVGGEATVVWHQRVFHPDYNWGEDYRYLLEGIMRRFGQT